MTTVENHGAPALAPFLKPPSEWPFVYRVSWFHADSGKTWTRRCTEKGAMEWIETFNSNKEYTLSKSSPPYLPEDTEWHDQLKVERAPVGEWEVIYSGA